MTTLLEDFATRLNPMGAARSAGASALGLQLKIAEGYSDDRRALSHVRRKLSQPQAIETSSEVNVIGIYGEAGHQ
jgi:hypothetical protein